MRAQLIAVIDTGGGEARLIARRIRALKTLAVTLGEGESLPEEAAGVVLAGSGRMTAAGAAGVEAARKRACPLLALGRSARALLTVLGGSTGPVRLEKGNTGVTFAENALFSGLAGCERYFERLEEWTLPEGAQVIARTADGTAAGLVDATGKAFALQFGVESNDPDGLKMLKSFVYDVCGLPGSWTMTAFLQQAAEKLAREIPEGTAAVGVSGGALSLAAAALALKALGGRVKCVACETGLMRRGEINRLKRAFEAETGAALEVADISGEVRACLAGVTNAEEKQIAVRAAVRRALARAGDQVILGAGEETAGVHVPLSLLYREEIRELGEQLGLSAAILGGQPFPEAGLALRLSGAVSEEALAALREADQTFAEEIEAAGLEKKLFRYFVTLSATPGGRFAAILHALVSGDAVTSYAYRLPYDLIERTVMRILRDQMDVEGVLYDVTGK